LVPPIKGKWFFPEGIFWAEEPPCFSTTRGTFSIGPEGKSFRAELRVDDTATDEFPNNVEYARFPLITSRIVIGSDLITPKLPAENTSLESIFFIDHHFIGNSVRVDLNINYKGYTEEFAFDRSLYRDAIVLSQLIELPPKFDVIQLPTMFNFPYLNDRYYLGGEAGLITAAQVPEQHSVILLGDILVSFILMCRRIV
ncbi:MAG: hypothetical protein SH868_03910, partial [Bythopirellula sp.]|nr:hypothetical protein [Bythopirellula sp.]